ncbi:hypothetical protein NBRC10512_002598 [Rhodotorula toruloides]|uniref:F-box domain containing protein n=1 Tax=Rhodotorula toruloides (strain NP11) TaxID=1130832 RepID=M7XJY1_RHOT1|nr:F-box domain containing protein [Rhodotorula toruloides NP11]EMS20468.1 F-box domain containing protein [Rhodotorula toruloides NP11]
MPTSLPLLLPDEIWLDILGSLRYMDLRRARRINKRFYQLVQDPKFDLALFRKSPVPASESEIEYKLHPVLDAYKVGSGTSWEMARLVHCHRGLTEGLDDPRGATYPSSNLYEYPVCAEFATSPACVKFSVKHDRTTLADLEDDGGVTVLQVLHAYASFWTALADPQDQDEFRSTHPWMTCWKDEPVPKWACLKMPFTSWRPLRCSGDRVFLEASMWYDDLADYLGELFGLFTRHPPNSTIPSQDDVTDSEKSEQEEW